ncbi:unnamed protein product [Soboliphyme baturini]|uniref:CBFD_NFYB_HMF domain-containing protein n=1 Tax=Soboliphyme baturini TaxID=241478 RepID=A0A183IHD7_9BILA|nr:unnamed protein product [Soboliphyme baturini]
MQLMLDEILMNVAANAAVSLLAFILKEVKDVEVTLGIHGKDLRVNCHKFHPAIFRNFTIATYKAKAADIAESDKEPKGI